MSTSQTIARLQTILRIKNTMHALQRAQRKAAPQPPPTDTIEMVEVAPQTFAPARPVRRTQPRNDASALAAAFQKLRAAADDDDQG